jgi:predicted RND superfamily exporter protein
LTENSPNFVVAYAWWVLRWRWPVVLACLLLAAAAASGIRFLERTADYRIYFGKENPQLNAYEALEDTYTKIDNIIFILQPKEKNVFTPKTLGIVKELTEAAWQIPYAARVDSITNFQHTEAVGDDLRIADLVERLEDLTAPRLAKIREVALNEPALVKRLIAADGGTTGVAVRLQFPGRDHTEHVPASVTRAEEMMAELRAAHPDLTVALTGMAAMSYTISRAAKSDSETLLPMMYVLIIAVMLVLLRSISATIAALVVITLSAAVAVGVMAWLGIKMSPTTAVAPVIILTLAVADSIHILMTTFDEMRGGRAKREALVESLRINAEPVFLTSLTTTIGFLSLNFSDAPPFRELGNIAAVGVVTAWVLSMTCIPALMSMLPVRIKRRATDARLPMDRFGDFVVSKRTLLLWGVTAAALLVIAFIPRLEIDDRFVEWFDESMPFRTDTDFATANLIGPYALEFSVGSGQPGGIAEPSSM